MRVLALIDAINVSGPGRQLVAIANALAPYGVDVTIGLFERSGTSPRPFAQFVRDHGVATATFTEHHAFDPAMIRAVSEYVQRVNPDVIQTHGYKPSAVAWVLRRQGNRRPWVAFFHGSTTENLKVRLYHALDQWLMKAADAVVLMSASHARALASRFRDAKVIHNAVLFPRDAGFDQAIPLANPPRLLVVGRLSSEKGVDVLLRAGALLAERGQSVGVTVLGDGPERVRLEQLAAALGLESVRFLGHAADPSPHYREADVLVIPSRSEGLPNVLLEAISHGLPVVATTVGAIPEVVTEDGVGRLCAPDDPTALADAIQACLQEGFRSAGIPGRERVLDAFSVERRAQRLLDLYRALGALPVISLPVEERGTSNALRDG